MNCMYATIWSSIKNCFRAFVLCCCRAAYKWSSIYLPHICSIMRPCFLFSRSLTLHILKQYMSPAHSFYYASLFSFFAQSRPSYTEAIYVSRTFVLLCVLVFFFRALSPFIYWSNIWLPHIRSIMRPCFLFSRSLTLMIPSGKGRHGD